jgi:hypothetical protein
VPDSQHLTSSEHPCAAIAGILAQDPHQHGAIVTTALLREPALHLHLPHAA